MENIKAYLQIQLKSHEDNFDVEYQLDEAGMECQMPNFLLQPIVENAICHGVDLCEYERGKIKIEYIYGEEFLVFHVYNNGLQVDKGELEKILNTLERGMEFIIFVKEFACIMMRSVAYIARLQMMV